MPTDRFRMIATLPTYDPLRSIRERIEASALMNARWRVHGMRIFQSNLPPIEISDIRIVNQFTPEERPDLDIPVGCEYYECWYVATWPEAT